MLLKTIALTIFFLKYFAQYLFRTLHCLRSLWKGLMWLISGKRNEYVSFGAQSTTEKVTYLKLSLLVVGWEHLFHLQWCSWIAVTFFAMINRQQFSECCCCCLLVTTYLLGQHWTINAKGLNENDEWILKICFEKIKRFVDCAYTWSGRNLHHSYTVAEALIYTYIHVYFSTPRMRHNWICEIDRSE